MLLFIGNNIPKSLYTTGVLNTRGVGIIMTDKLSYEELQALVEGLTQEVIEKEQNLCETRESAGIDGMTGLYNRSEFDKTIASEFKYANKDGRRGRGFSVAFIDLDGFKKYNDKYGHPAGDWVLKSFAQSLSKNLRNTDKAYVCRVGGDEFAAILPETDGDGAFSAVERVRSDWPRNYDLKSTDEPLGFSAGIATFSKGAKSPEAIVASADDALYRSKHLGKYVTTKASDIVEAVRNGVYEFS